MKALPVNVQITLLETLEWYTLERSPGFEVRGLCYLLRNKAREYLKSKGEEVSLPYELLKDIFPLFTRENAVKYFRASDGTDDDDYWWALNASGDQQRMKFINWIINMLKQSE